MQHKRMFFFEKKNQKTLIISASVCQERLNPNSQKFFGSFFQKRTAFCCLPWPAQKAFRNPWPEATVQAAGELVLRSIGFRLPLHPLYCPVGIVD
jgi:hypothetical protein